MTPRLQDRRAFIKAMMAAGGAASALLPSIARALDIPAHRRTGTIRDVEHVVILTQENRAFDHYFGAMHGVRGFGDRFAIPAPPLPGATVWSLPQCGQIRSCSGSRSPQWRQGTRNDVSRSARFAMVVVMSSSAMRRSCVREARVR